MILRYLPGMAHHTYDPAPTEVPLRRRRIEGVDARRRLLSMALVFSTGLAIGLGVEAVKNTELRSMWQQLFAEVPPAAARSATSGSAQIASDTRALAHVARINGGDAGTSADLQDLGAIIDRQLEDHEV